MSVLFTNVRILDGTGAQPYAGDVLVQGNRIARVGRGVRALSPSGVTVIDGGGATLMPGMVEAHTHFSWNDQATLGGIQRMPTEEHILWCAHIAQRYLDMGWTSCMGAATAKPRLDVVIRNAIESGQIPGPRYLAASQEITVPGGLGDETPPHLPYPEFSFGAIVSGPEEMRRTVRMFLKYGVDTMKLNLSGEYIAGLPAEFTPMTDEEIAVAVREVRLRGKRLSAHARSSESVKQCVRHGIEIIYHASFADEEALDMLEAAKDKHFVAPGLGWLINTSYNAAAWGITPDQAREMGYHRELEVACETLKKMHRRGIRDPARRRLRVRLDAPRHQREGPRVLRQAPQLHADGGDRRRHPAGRPDHDARPRAGSRSRRARSPTCCWSTAIRSPTSRSSRIAPGCWPS